MSFNTDEFFVPGTLSTILDAQAGSSGKGVIGSYVCAHSSQWQFACNAFSAQAGHWVKIDKDRSYFYQTFNSCAYNPDKYEKLYIGPDASLELPAFWREIEQNNIPAGKIGLSPLAAIIQDHDMAYERGEITFDGETRAIRHDGTMKTGSTCHGVGACRARRLLRRPEVVLARDVPALKEFLCDVPGEIMDRLDRGQAGLLEIAQGFQLSLLGQFYPYVTSRNVTVSAGFDGMMLPPRYAGHTLLNIRTFPIRISSFKYLDENGKHLTWKEVQECEASGRKYTKYEGNSGTWYDDQSETTWDEITKNSGSPTQIMEITSVTKLPRRVATFSKENLKQAIRYNQPPGDSSIFLSVNFMNYVDHSVAGLRGDIDLPDKCETWLQQNIDPVVDAFDNVVLRYIGTGALTDDKLIIED